jgi:YfiH family protein
MAGLEETLRMELLLSSAALAAAGFAHGFSTRAVDLAPSSPAYTESLARFLAEARIDVASLRHANQVHGARVVRASDVSLDARPNADALVSFEALAVGVRVADCVPVLVADRASGAVAAIHAGWKGFVAGVGPAALRALSRREGSRADRLDLVAAIGPSIGPCCFEVGADVAGEIDAAAGASVSRPAHEANGSGDPKRLVDLRAAVRAHLVAAGVAAASIDDVPGCTRCEPARFFSYRRGGEKGRMLAVIAPSAASRREASG